MMKIAASHFRICSSSITDIKGTFEFNVMHCMYVIISITKFLGSCHADLYGALFYGLQTELNRFFSTG